MAESLEGGLVKLELGLLATSANIQIGTLPTTAAPARQGRNVPTGCLPARSPLSLFSGLTRGRTVPKTRREGPNVPWPDTAGRADRPKFHDSRLLSALTVPGFSL